MKYNFIDGLAIKIDENNKYGFINKSGEEVIECKYDFAGLFNEGLARICLNDKWGFIDKTGKELVECKYDSIEEFSEGLAKVEKGGKIGFINKLGEEVIACQFGTKTKSFKNGTAFIQQDKKSGLINKNGEVVFIFKGNILSFNEGLAIVKQGIKYGIIDTSYNLILPCIYDYIYPFKNGLYIAKLNGKAKFFDKFGKEIKILEEIVAGTKKFSSIPKEYVLDDYFFYAVTLIISKKNNIMLDDSVNKLINKDIARLEIEKVKKKVVNMRKSAKKEFNKNLNSFETLEF